MKVIVYLVTASVVVMTLIVGFTFVTTIIEVYTLGNRVEDSVIAAGWAGFSKVDFDMLARRVQISDEAQREIYLDKAAARDTVIEYIKMNLKLDGSFYPIQESYIQNKDNPVIIQEIEVYNPDDLPAACSKGVAFERTTIHVILSIPIDVKWLEFKYMDKHVDIDVKSFFNN